MEEKCDFIHTVKFIISQFNFLWFVRFFWMISCKKWRDFYFGLLDECFLFYIFIYLFIFVDLIFSPPWIIFCFQISKSNVVDDMVGSNKILYGSDEKPDHCVVIKYVPYVGKLVLMLIMLLCSLENEKY
jgi:hypothetical protein